MAILNEADVLAQLNRLEKAHKPLPVCMFCQKMIQSSKDVGYTKSKSGERYFHMKCYLKEYGKVK